MTLIQQKQLHTCQLHDFVGPKSWILGLVRDNLGIYSIRFIIETRTKSSFKIKFDARKRVCAFLSERLAE